MRPSDTEVGTGIEGGAAFDAGPFPVDAWALLSPALTDQRRERLMTAAKNRTRRLRLVVQDIHHPHNVSACLRSAEAFGVADVDIVNHRQSFRPSTVAKGVGEWLNIHKHDSIESCAAYLREAGYQIAAGFPAQGATPLYALPVDRPLAVVFGNEHAGIAGEWLPYIDLRFTIPMVGLVESLNISVSAAITLQSLTHKARTSLGDSSYLISAAEQSELLNRWICRQVPTWRSQLELLRNR